MAEKFTKVSAVPQDADWKVVHRLADKHSPELQKTFLAMVARARGGIRASRIKSALRRGNTRLATELAVVAWNQATQAWRFQVAVQFRAVVNASARIVCQPPSLLILVRIGAVTCVGPSRLPTAQDRGDTKALHFIRSSVCEDQAEVNILRPGRRASSTAPA